MLRTYLAIGVTITLLLGTAFYTAYTMGVTLDEVRSFRDSQVQRLKIEEMTKIHKSKVVEGETITLICCQMEGETFRDFLKRCNEEWKLLCESL